MAATIDFYGNYTVTDDADGSGTTSVGDTLSLYNITVTYSDMDGVSAGDTISYAELLELLTGSANDGDTFTFGSSTFEITSTDSATTFGSNGQALTGGLGIYSADGTAYDGTWTITTLSATTSGTFLGEITVDTSSASPVPLPAGLPLLAGGLGALALIRRGRRRS